jgi:hypothetical protein
MSRSLGNRVRNKAAHKAGSYEEEGRAMFGRGEPCPPKPSDRGKAYAKWRGWQRAATAARITK